MPMIHEEFHDRLTYQSDTSTEQDLKSVSGLTLFWKVGL